MDNEDRAENCRSKHRDNFPDEAYLRLMRTILNAQPQVGSLLDEVRIIKNPPKRATTVLWGDGTVTIVRAEEGITMDDYAAFTAAFAKRLIGSNSRVKSIVSKTKNTGKRIRS